MSEYPQQVEDRIPENWGKSLDIPEEWYQHVTNLDMIIALMAPNYVILQVKKKFGGLRFYIDVDSIPEFCRETVDDLIALAERESFTI